MKALSLKQPWAGMIANGEKTIETRTWRTNHRGDLLICSSKKFDEYATPDMFSDATCFVRGMTICVVNVVACVPMEEKHVIEACCDVYEGAWAWILEDIRIVKNLPVKGVLNIFDAPYELKDLLI